MLYHYRSYQKSSKYQESVKLIAVDTSFPKLFNFHLYALTLPVATKTKEFSLK